MDDKLIKVAIYSRVSTQEQAVEGTSLEHQQEQLKKYCESQGWEIFQAYVDAGYTGKDDNRPGLKHLMADAKFGLFNKVVVYKMDRLARNLRLLLEIEDKLKENGISFHSVKEAFDTSTASGRHFLQMLGMISEWERETIIERTKAGRLQRYKEGCWGPGSPVYGYDYDKETKKLVINEDEARVVQRIFEVYSTGKSMTYISHMLNSEKVSTRSGRGKGWRNGSIRDTLLNPAYTGTQIVNVHQNHTRLPKEIPNHAIVIKVPAIVSEELWNTAQERRKNNKHVQPTKNVYFFLQGLVTCGLCGYSFRTEYTHSRRTYGCRGRLKYTHIDGSPRCISPHLDAEWLESQVWNRIEEIIDDPNKLEKLLIDTIDSLTKREAELYARIKPIDKRLTEIDQQKAILTDDCIKRNTSIEKYHEWISNLEQEESRLRSIRSENDPVQLEELEHTRSVLQFWNKPLKTMAWNTENEDGSMIKVAERPHKTALKIVGLEDSSITSVLGFPATRRELLDLLQVRIVVFMNRVEINAIFPIEPIDYQLLQPNSR